MELGPEIIGCLAGKVTEFLGVLLYVLLEDCHQLHQPAEDRIGRLNTEFVWRLNYKEAALELIHQRGSVPQIMITQGTVWITTKTGPGAIIFVVNRVQSVPTNELPQPDRVVSTQVLAETT